MLSLGLQEEGLFRRSPNSVALRNVQAAYDRGTLSNILVKFYELTWLQGKS